MLAKSEKLRQLFVKTSEEGKKPDESEEEYLERTCKLFDEFFKSRIDFKNRRNIFFDRPLSLLEVDELMNSYPEEFRKYPQKNAATLFF
jgi:hypothetical protein